MLQGFYGDPYGEGLRTVLQGFYGDPYGIRTRVTAVKGRCLRPLDQGAIHPVTKLIITKHFLCCKSF